MKTFKVVKQILKEKEICFILALLVAKPKTEIFEQVIFFSFLSKWYIKGVFSRNIDEQLKDPRWGYEKS